MRSRVATCCVSILLFGSVPARAQVIGVIDLETGTRYVWHGLSRASDLYVMPTEALSGRFDMLSFEAGSSQETEPHAIGRGTLSESGSTGRHLGEVDIWGGAALILGPASLGLGAIRYTFHGDPVGGGEGPKANTTELHLSLATSGVYLNPRLDAWWDVERVHGVFLDAEGSVPVLGFPFRPFFFLAVDGEVGVNFSQEPRNGTLASTANFAEQGITHASLGASIQVANPGNPDSPWAAVAVGGRAQLNFDPKTQFDGATGARRVIGVGWVRLTLLLGQLPRSPE